MNISEIHKLYLASNSISTDTRKIDKGALFFALKGDNFNGNTFAKSALENGAYYAIIDEAEFNVSDKYILVNNVLETLQKLATYHRNYLGTKIIALTGSNGKTTTKELINSVLSQAYTTLATQGNLNNHIGVPLTLLSMNENTEIGIVEMGANHLNEIEFLCSIALPDYGYITNFGKAHLEGFGSLEGVVKGKSEMYRHLIDNDKIVFVNSNDKKQLELTTDYKNTVVINNNIDLVEANPFVKVKFDDLIIESNLIGDYNFSNISAAIGIGNYLNVDPQVIKKGIENYVPQNNRSQIIEKGNIQIILDAYNANPSSMKAALDNFAKINSKTKIVILGDMFELGTDAKEEHEDIINLALSKEFDSIYLVGENFFNTSINNSSIIKYKSFDDLKLGFKNQTLKASSILIKGSRGMALERILDLL